MKPAYAFFFFHRRSWCQRWFYTLRVDLRSGYFCTDLINLSHVPLWCDMAGNLNRTSYRTKSLNSHSLTPFHHQKDKKKKLPLPSWKRSFIAHIQHLELSFLEYRGPKCPDVAPIQLFPPLQVLGNHNHSKLWQKVLALLVPSWWNEASMETLTTTGFILNP